MTVPPSFRAGAQRVSDMVVGMFPSGRGSVTEQERNMREHLAGNEKLYDALTDLIASRIRGRARLPMPSDPLLCYGSMARDRELQWLLGRLGFIYDAPADEQFMDSGEQPAA